MNQQPFGFNTASLFDDFSQSQPSNIGQTSQNLFEDSSTNQNQAQNEGGNEVQSQMTNGNMAMGSAGASGPGIGGNEGSGGANVIPNNMFD